MVESSVEHAHYVFAFVVDDLVCPFVPEYRDGVSPPIVLVGFKIDFVQEFGMEEVVDCAAGVFVVGGGEAPAAVIFGVGFYNAHGEEPFEAFEFAGDQDAVGEGTEKADVKMVAVCFNGELFRAKLMPPGAAICGGIIPLGHDGEFRGGEGIRERELFHQGESNCKNANNKT